jgi:septum formation protein
LDKPFQVIEPDADESIESSWLPDEIVVKLAKRKVSAAYEKLRLFDQPMLIIGADTIVVYQGEILGKPMNKQHAFTMLKKLQGNTHDVYTGVAIYHSITGEIISSFEKTMVTMKCISDDRIHEYVDTQEPLDKAGGYGIQGKAAKFITSIDGCYYNVVGLPMSLLDDLLTKCEITKM